MRTWLLLSHLIVFALPIFALIATGSLADELRRQTAEDLRNQAALVHLLIASELRATRIETPGATLQDAADGLSLQLTAAREATLAGLRVVDERGVVVASSGDEIGVDLSYRPEVQRAIAGAQGLEVRPREPPRAGSLDSPSRRSNVRVFLGVPLHLDGEHVGAIVLSRTPREEVQALYRMVPWWVAVVPAIVTIFGALLLGTVLSRTLMQLESTTHRIAAGVPDAARDLDWAAGSRISEVRGLSLSFRAMADKLQARIAYISEFASHVSHEFKTPIATLRATAELLRDDRQMPEPQQQRFLTNAVTELDRLSKLVTGLLALARAEETPSDHGPISLDDIAADVAHAYGISLDGSSGPIVGHAGQLRTALQNLVENAVRHAEEEVHLALWTGEGHTGVDVFDDGPGVSEANEHKVFARFFTTARDEGGTGLGLALVQAIVQAHGGLVSCDRIDARTRFRIRLPIGVDSGAPRSTQGS